MKYISKKIVYDVIPEKLFKEFINLLKKVNKEEAKKESKDGFLDLYNYWEKVGLGRFKNQLERLKKTDKHIK